METFLQNKLNVYHFKMNEKTKKIIFEYSKNSRITTQELGRKVGASQQSASYLLNSLKISLAGVRTIFSVLLILFRFFSLSLYEG